MDRDKSIRSRGVGDAELKPIRCETCGETITDEQAKLARLEERLPKGREWAYVHREDPPGHDLILEPLPEPEPPEE